MFRVNELLEATGGKLVSGSSIPLFKGLSIDSRTTKRGDVFAAIKGRNFDGHSFISEAVRKGAGCVIQSAEYKAQRPGVSVISVQDTTKALGDIARWQRKKIGVPVIAVTGSNGKTTTKEMTAEVLSRRFKVLKNAGSKNNHIGLPLALAGLDSSYDCAVLELGANHPGEIEYLAKICMPNLAILTNIGFAHLENFKDLKGVFKEKFSLVENLSCPRIAVLNADDPFLRRRLVKAGGGSFNLGVGLSKKSDFCAAGIKSGCGEIGFSLNLNRFTLKTPGYYNIYNALAAIAVGRLFGVSYEDMREALGSFSFPEGRLNFVKAGEVNFINDTYNANPSSLKHALHTLESFPVQGRRILIMGDMLELGQAEELLHRQAGGRIAEVCDVFVSVGKLSRIAAEEARSAGFGESRIFSCSSSLEARKVLFRKIAPAPDDIVLIKGSRAMKMERILDAL